MNRRDAAFLAHLDTIEDRYLSVIRSGFAEVAAEFDVIKTRLDRIQEDIAGIKVELATHHHDD